jgi:hypothetical protein
METNILQDLISRDLLKLREEIDSYSSEEKIWYIERNIANSAGNLCLHLVGNLNTFIGKELGKTNYERNRPLEFSQKGIPKITLLKQIDDTIDVVQQSLEKVRDTDLSAEYPTMIFDEKRSMRYTLIHLAMHLSYHLGQINYHRRLLDGHNN